MIEGNAIQYNNGKIQRETAYIQIAVQSCCNILWFDIMNMKDYFIILKIL